jgi:hypothetical protein
MNSTASNIQGPEDCLLHAARQYDELRSDQYAAPREHADRGEGYQEFRPRVFLKSPGRPELGVYSSPL